MLSTPWVVDDDPLRFERNEDGIFYLTDPIQARADHLRIEEYLGLFLDGEVKEYVTESAENLGIYGLENPELELRFTAAGVEDGASIAFGKLSDRVRRDYSDQNEEEKDIPLLGKAPGLYAEIGDSGEVVILDTEFFTRFPHTVWEGREKRIYFGGIQDIPEDSNRPRRGCDIGRADGRKGVVNHRTGTTGGWTDWR